MADRSADKKVVWKELQRAGPKDDLRVVMWAAWLAVWMVAEKVYEMAALSAAWLDRQTVEWSAEKSVAW